MFEDTATLIEWLRESDRHFSATKTFSKKARDYYNGDQLDETIKTILFNRGQPEQYENQIAKHNNAILGFKQERDTEVWMFGRQQRDRASADMYNSLLKAELQVEEYETQEDAMDEYLSLEGCAVSELRVRGTKEKDRFGRQHKQVYTVAVDPNECYLDPFSRAKNYNDDARYLSRAFWTDKEELLKLGIGEETIRRLSNVNFIADLHDDDLYADEMVRERVLLVYTWYRKYDKEAKRDRFYYVFWSDTEILLQGESPYEEIEGFPYEVEFLHRDYAGEYKYWGLYRDVIPIQDGINYAKLRLHNMLGNNKTLVQRGAVENQDVEQFAEEWNMDNAVVGVEDINGVKEFKQNVLIQQILNVIIDGRNQISELLNSNKELLGTANNRMSGVGQERRIETGLVGLKRFTDAADRLQKRIIRKMVGLMQQYYDTERIISIIDEDYAQDYLVMNEAVVNERGAVEFEMLENGTVRPVVTNSVKIGKYDLIYETKPKSSSMSAERLKQNVELLKVLQITDPSLVKYLVPDILRDNNSPSARKIRAIIEQQDAAAANSPEAQRSAQLEAANAQLELRLKASEANLKDAKATSLLQRNKIDLQKAFSRALVDKAVIQVKRDKNMQDAMRRIR
jgi:hypothetical protein